MYLITNDNLKAVIHYLRAVNGARNRRSRFACKELRPSASHVYYLITNDNLKAVIHYLRAVNGARTRDPQLGKLMLYQLSYYRVALFPFAKIQYFSKWLMLFCNLFY